MPAERRAAEHHPGWHYEDHVYTKLDPKAPEEAELVEWFYKNYPREAREIEDDAELERRTERALKMLDDKLGPRT